MSRDVEVKNTTTIMSHNDKGEQDLEPNRWDSEEFTKPAIKLFLTCPFIEPHPVEWPHKAAGG